MHTYTVTQTIREFKKFLLCCKNLNKQARSSRSKATDYKALLWAREANPASSSWSILCQLSILQTSGSSPLWPWQKHPELPNSHRQNIAKYIGIMVRAFANGPGDLGSIPGRVIPKTQKMVLDATLLNTQHYKVRIKGKVEQSRERSSALPYTLV